MAKKKLLISVLIFSLTTMAYARTPVWTFSTVPNYPPQITISVVGYATVQYLVTNQSRQPHHLTMRPIAGVTASGCASPLGYHQTCLLNLEINGSALRGDVTGGPILCDRSNRNECYQPGINAILRIHRSPDARATFTVAPRAVNLILGGSYQTVLVQNTSSVDIENLQINIPGSSEVILDSTYTTCTNSLGARASCSYALLPGSNEENPTPVRIRGSNTVNVAVVDVTVSPAIINLSPPSLILYAGASGLPVRVTNTSSAMVTDLQILNLPSGVNIEPSSTCVVGGSLAAGAHCIFVFSASSIFATSEVNIKGANSNLTALTLTALAPTVLNVTSPTAVQILDANSSSTLAVTVENTGPLDAQDVKLTSAWAGVTFNPTSCGTIPIGQSCNFTIQSNTPNVAGQISIQGSNAATVKTPYIAFRYGGGLVFATSGLSPNRSAKIITETNVGLGTWRNGSDIDTGASDFYNGANVDPGNTYKIIQAQGSGNYAANLCATYTGGSSNTWYLPATCELGVGGFRAPCVEGTANVTTNLYSHGFNLNLIVGDYYWASTQNVFNNAQAYQSLIQIFNNNATSMQDSLLKSYFINVRCARVVSY